MFLSSQNNLKLESLECLYHHFDLKSTTKNFISCFTIVVVTLLLYHLELYHLGTLAL